MRKALFVVCIILSLFQLAGSQSAIGFPGTIDLHVSPLLLFDRNPRLRLGMEYHTHHHLGYSLDVGWGSNALNHAQLARNQWGKDYSFFEIRPELKWYQKEMPQFATYFSAELFYLHMKDKLENQYYYEGGEPYSAIYYDEASFKKDKIGLQLKAGIKFLFSKRIAIDLYEGFGIAHRHISYTDIVNPMHPDYPPVEEWYVAPFRNDGNAFIFQLAFGMRIGYVITTESEKVRP